MFKERMDKIAHGLAQGYLEGMSDVLLGYGEQIGRYKEIEDYIEMTFEDLKGGQ